MEGGSDPESTSVKSMDPRDHGGATQGVVDGSAEEREANWEVTDSVTEWSLSWADRGEWYGMVCDRRDRRTAVRRVSPRVWSGRSFSWMIEERSDEERNRGD